MDVNRSIRKEATPFLYIWISCTLYIYLLFNENEACESEVDGGLSAAMGILKSKSFPHVQACVIDVRLFCGSPSFHGGRAP